MGRVHVKETNTAVISATTEINTSVLTIESTVNKLDDKIKTLEKQVNNTTETLTTDILTNSKRCDSLVENYSQLLHIVKENNRKVESEIKYINAELNDIQIKINKFLYYGIYSLSCVIIALVVLFCKVF